MKSCLINYTFANLDQDQFFFLLCKVMFSKKATKFDKIFTGNLTLCSRRLVGSTDQAYSELGGNQWNNLLFIEIVPSHCLGASEVQTQNRSKQPYFSTSKKVFLIIKIRIIFALKCFLKIEIFQGHEV